MKTITIELDPESAKELLASLERKISEKQQTREELSDDIAKLEYSADKMRDQLHGLNGNKKKPRGQNREKALEYLRNLNGRGATITAISKSTGVGISSTAYTLKNNPKDFEYQEKTGLWKLK